MTEFAIYDKTAQKWIDDVFDDYEQAKAVYDRLESAKLWQIDSEYDAGWSECAPSCDIVNETIIDEK